MMHQIGQSTSKLAVSQNTVIWARGCAPLIDRVYQNYTQKMHISSSLMMTPSRFNGFLARWKVATNWFRFHKPAQINVGLMNSDAIWSTLSRLRSCVCNQWQTQMKSHSARLGKTCFDRYREVIPLSWVWSYTEFIHTKQVRNIEKSKQI